MNEGYHNSFLLQHHFVDWYNMIAQCEFVDVLECIVPLRYLRYVDPSSTAVVNPLAEISATDLRLTHIHYFRKAEDGMLNYGGSFNLKMDTRRFVAVILNLRRLKLRPPK